jgi:hypothetical protein
MFLNCRVKNFRRIQYGRNPLKLITLHIRKIRYSVDFDVKAGYFYRITLFDILRRS